MVGLMSILPNVQAIVVGFCAVATAVIYLSILVHQVGAEASQK